MMLLGSRLNFLAYLCLISEVFTGELVKTPDGNGLFITGRGCGGSTKIRYLTYIPKDLDKHECTFINLENTKPPVKEGLPSNGTEYRLYSIL